MSVHEHEVEYVGPQHFLDMDAPLFRALLTEGHAECAAAFVDWIEQDFPDEVWVGEVAGPDVAITRRMTANNLVDAAWNLLMMPLPMPDDLSGKVSEYLGGEPDDETEPLTWDDALWSLQGKLNVP